MPWRITFKHIGGLAVIRIDKMPSMGTLTITADQQLAGEFTVDCSAKEPTMTTTTAEDGTNGIIINFDATMDEAGVFYLPLATGDYTNFNIALKSSIRTTSVTYDQLSITRANVQALALKYSDGSLAKDESSSDGGDETQVINGHEYVDLGLSVLWATTNIGADTETDYGDYFAWGDTETREEYYWYKYKFGKEDALTKYNSTDDFVLETGDDAAYQKWGSDWRMPTKDNFEELIAKCTWKRTTENEVTGYRVTSNVSGYTGKSIFLPCAGMYSYSSKRDDGSFGYYWTKTRDEKTATDAYCLYMGYSSAQTTIYNRYLGYPIRPVADKQN